MRRVRCIRPRRRISPDSTRAACPAAPRPGGVRYRLLRRQTISCRTPYRAGRRCILQTRHHETPEGPRGSRPYAVFNDRRTGAAQCAANVRRTVDRRICRGPQWQYHQWPGTAPLADCRRCHLPVHIGHGSCAAPGGPLSPAPPCRSFHRCDQGTGRCLFTGLHVCQENDRACAIRWASVRWYWAN